MTHRPVTTSDIAKPKSSTLGGHSCILQCIGGAFLVLLTQAAQHQSGKWAREGHRICELVHMHLYFHKRNFSLLPPQEPGRRWYIFTLHAFLQLSAACLRLSASLTLKGSVWNKIVLTLLAVMFSFHPKSVNLYANIWSLNCELGAVTSVSLGLMFSELIHHRLEILRRLISLLNMPRPFLPCL